jgi:cellulose synthase/poly-beta-1,6-N-acetylglucosamine synthase-like glycosyltransferase
MVMLLVWIGASLYLIINCRKIQFLKDIAPLTSSRLPAVTVIIPVRNEEREVEQALRSVCQLEYANMNIVVINDRSTDGTAAILERMAQEHPQLHLITVGILPEGWLGKNHALYQGYRASLAAEWLLFTDADVQFEPLALRRAMQYVLQHQPDHVTVLPEVTTQSRLFRSVMSTFAFMLNIKLRPWAASDPSSGAAMGVGAFNLVRRAAYEQAGTHSAISLRPDDDLKLGAQIKKAGFKQAVL